MMYTLRWNMEIITGYAEERPEVWTAERENTGRKCKRDEVDMHKWEKIAGLQNNAWQKIETMLKYQSWIAQVRAYAGVVQW